MLNRYHDFFEKMGLSKGDNVLCHSSAYSLGLASEDEVDDFLKALISYLGPAGALVFPSFTYSFRVGKVFSVEVSPVSKQLGIMPERFRKFFAIDRTHCGLFSHSGTVLFPEEFKRKQTICFGEYSIYDFFEKNNFKFLSLGVGFSSGMTPFLHAEKLARVPYRSDLKLDGVIVSKARQHSAQSLHFALNDSFHESYHFNRDSVGLLALNAKVICEVEFARGLHRVTRLDDFIKFVVSELQDNDLAMIERK